MKKEPSDAVGETGRLLSEPFVQSARAFGELALSFGGLTCKRRFHLGFAKRCRVAFSIRGVLLFVVVAVS